MICIKLLRETTTFNNKIWSAWSRMILSPYTRPHKDIIFCFHYALLHFFDLALFLLRFASLECYGLVLCGPVRPHMESLGLSLLRFFSPLTLNRKTKLTFTGKLDLPFFRFNRRVQFVSVCFRFILLNLILTGSVCGQ